MDLENSFGLLLSNECRLNAMQDFSACPREGGYGSIQKMVPQGREEPSETTNEGVGRQKASYCY